MCVCVTRSHKTHDKSGIKKYELHICVVVDQYPVFILMKRLIYKKRYCSFSPGYRVQF